MTKEAVRIPATSVSQVSSRISRKDSSGCCGATLLTTTSSRPAIRTASLMAASLASVSLTFHTSAFAFEPSRSISSVTLCNRFCAMSPTKMCRAPSFAKRKAVALPKPLPAPVMSTLLPSKRPLTVRPPSPCGLDARRAHWVFEAPNSIDLQSHDITGPQALPWVHAMTDPGGRARANDVARFECEPPAAEADQGWNVEDEF